MLAGPESELDPVTLRVIGGAFNAVAHEMAQTAMRMSFSSIIRESEDLGAGLFDADGEELCESDTTPLQAGPLPWSIRGILDRMRETGQAIDDGDVFIHNHPYHGASHSPDVMIAVPIFHEGEHVAWSACVAHLLDIGGSAPGINPDSIDLWAEGKIYWALKIHERGVRNSQLWTHIFENVRTGHMNEGDVEALLRPACSAATASSEIVEKYGVEPVMKAASDWKDYSERMLRREIEKLPDGEYVAPVALFDNDGQTLDKPLPIHTKVIIEGSNLTVDLEGTHPEVPTGINVPFEGSTQMAAYFTVRSIFMDEATYAEFIPQNEGMFRPIKITAPKGSLFNPNFPRSCFSRFPQLQRLADNIVLRAVAGAGGEGDGRHLGALPLLRLRRLRQRDRRVLDVPRGERGLLRRAAGQGRHGRGGLAHPEHAQQPDRGARVDVPDALRALRAARAARRPGAVARGHGDHP